MRLETLVYIALILMFVIPGFLAIWVGVRGSAWFFSSPSYRYMVERIGMRWSRVLFVVLGIVLISVAVMVLIDPMEVMKGVKR